MVDVKKLPVDDHIDEIVRLVRAERSAVIVAPPGSGKTTRIPPALTAIGRTILLQPRRIAARTLARRIAFERGWSLGEEIGWAIRFERRFTKRTQLLVATEGILTARLQADPLLSDFDVVVLDEFHERSIHADLAVALAKQAADSRGDLALVVLSATIDATAIASFLGARVIEIDAKPFPVEVRYAPGRSMAQAVADVARDAKGHVLCFLPGVREIERTRAELEKALLAARCPLPESTKAGTPGNGQRAAGSVIILPLHGSLDVDAQERALAPSAQRKIILATNVAETSLTVEGVTDVVDSGLHKVLRYDAETVVDHLETEQISRDSADQRAGRAGRTQPGRATRLWDERAILRPHREPEVRRIDLASAALDILAWGGDPRTFAWFERPPDERIDRAIDLLQRLGAIEVSGTVGRATQCHPERVAAWARRIPSGDTRRAPSAGDPSPPTPPPAQDDTGEDGGETTTRSPGNRQPATGNAVPRLRMTPLGDVIRRFPLHPRLARVLVAAHGADEAVRICAQLSDDRVDYASELSRIARHILGDDYRRDADDVTIRRALLAGYPDRVAMRREPGSSRVLLSSGTGAVLAREIDTHEGEFLVALDVVGGAESLVRMASVVEREWLTPTHRDLVHAIVGDRVRATERLWYDSILLAEVNVAPDAEEARRLKASRLRERIDPGLQRRIDFADVVVDWSAIIASTNDVSLPFDLRRRVDQLAPERLALPSGRTVKLDYRDDGSVVASAKLQELFGLAETPRIGPRRTPVTFALLAPNGRPVQITRDLHSFWTTVYQEVRKELRGRYPKHPWPEDPWSAQATHRTKR